MVLGINFVGRFGEAEPVDPEADENEIAERDWRVDGRASCPTLSHAPSVSKFIISTGPGWRLWTTKTSDTSTARKEAASLASFPTRNVSP